ncbi:hypothetical protein QJ359_004413 [Vibrio vulnificus]|nr:hypothetical protein [Vibrio vulnificus]
MSSILKVLKSYNGSDESNENDVFITWSHPSINLPLEQKITYLHGLGLIMACDNELHESEKKFISKLIQMMDLPKELLEEVEKNSKSVDESFLEEFKRSILNSLELGCIFFYDAVMLCFQDGNYCETEQKVIKELSRMAFFPNDELTLVEKTIKAIHSRSIIEINSIEGERYWNWVHLIQCENISFRPKIIKVGNCLDFASLRASMIDYSSIYRDVEIILGEDDGYQITWLDIEGFCDTRIIGSENTTIWLVGEENDTFDDEFIVNAHSHEIDMGVCTLTSISNCKIRTEHSNLLILTCGIERLFNNCDLENVSEADGAEHRRLQVEAAYSSTFN